MNNKSNPRLSRRPGSLSPAAPPSATDEQSTLFSRPLGGVLRRRRAMVMLVAGTCVVGVGVFTALTPERWTSTATILVEPQSVTAGESDLLRRFGQVSRVETEMAMLNSRTVVEPAVKSLGLHVSVLSGGKTVATRSHLLDVTADSTAVGRGYRIQGLNTGMSTVTDLATGVELGRAAPRVPFERDGLKFALAEAPAGTIEVAVEPFGAAVAATMERVSVRRAAEEADLLQLTCHGPTPDGAQALCQEVSASYMALRTTLQRAEATATASFLDEQVDNVHGLLLALEDSLEALARETEVVDLPGQASETARRYADLSAQRDVLARERSALIELVGTIDSDGALSTWRDVASFPTFLENPIVASLLTSLVSLENEQSDLASRRTEANPERLAVGARIEEIHGQLRQFATNYQESLDAQIRSIDGSLVTAESMLERFPTKQVQFARLERQGELLGNLYRLLETQRREAQVAEAVDLPNVRIIDQASLPLAPSAPIWPRNLALAGLLGLAAGVAMAFFRDLNDKRLHGKREVEYETGLSVLGLLPSIAQAGAVFEGGLIRRRVPRNENSARRQEVMQEAFRGLLTDLRFAARRQAAKPLKTLAVLSASPSEGKTFTASNIAMAQATVGARTLLIDADMRAAGVTHLLGFPPISGLSDVLEGKAAVSDVLRTVSISPSNPSSSGQLTVLPAGPPTPNSAALLQDGAFQVLLDHLEEDYDMIVIDTPPLNVLSDGMTISAGVDGVLLVVRGGRTDRDSLDLALERLDRVEAPVLGVVLNDVAVPRHYGEYKRDYGQLAGVSAGWAQEAVR